MQTANNVSEVVGVDVEDPADDDADGDVSFTTPTMESPSRAISNDDNENPSSINTTKWRFISFAAFLVAAVIIVVEISVDLPFDGGNESRYELSTPASNASAKKVKNSPGMSLIEEEEGGHYLHIRALTLILFFRLLFLCHVQYYISVANCRSQWIQLMQRTPGLPPKCTQQYCPTQNCL